MSLVQVKTEGSLVSITLNRPDKHNALSPDMLRALLDAFESLAEDGNCKAVLLSGGGKSFCSGADRKAVAQLSSSDEIRAYAGLMRNTMSAIRNCKAPVIACVHGYALGAGCGLVTICDVSVAASDAVFGFPEMRHGILPALVVPGLVERIGAKSAFPLLATGQSFDTKEAFSLGVIDKIADGDPATIAREMALGLANTPSGYVRKLRKLVAASVEQGFNPAIELAMEYNIDARLQAASKRDGQPN